MKLYKSLKTGIEMTELEQEPICSFSQWIDYFWNTDRQNILSTQRCTQQGTSNTWTQKNFACRTGVA